MRRVNNPKKKKPDDAETIITVSSKPDVKPAPETIPDQEILKKPAPIPGMNLLESWKHPSKK